MAKKKQAGGANEAAWVTEPEAAPAGKPFCDVTYVHRCHSETIEVLGIPCVPGQIVTYRTRADVPEELLAHPELQTHDVAFGVCRIDPMFRYTPLTQGAYESLKAAVAPVPEPEPEPEPEGE